MERGIRKKEEEKQTKLKGKTMINDVRKVCGRRMKRGIRKKEEEEKAELKGKMMINDVRTGL